MNDFDYNWRRTFGWPKYCITNPPLKEIIEKYPDKDTTHILIYDLDALCSCGKPYRHHDKWKSYNLKKLAEWSDRVIIGNAGGHEIAMNRDKTLENFVTNAQRYYSLRALLKLKIKSFLDSF